MNKTRKRTNNFKKGDSSCGIKKDKSSQSKKGIEITEVDDKLIGDDLAVKKVQADDLNLTVELENNKNNY